MVQKLKALPKERGIKIHDSHAWGVCQFHRVSSGARESTPSFFINLKNNGKHKAGTGHCYACLHPEEEIRTQRGLVPIKNIKKGDSVYDHKGNSQLILKLIKKPRLTKIIEFTTYRNNCPTKVTTDHEMLIFKNGFIKTVLAKNVKKGDYFVFPVSVEEKNIKEFDTSHFIYMNRLGPTKNRVRIRKLPLTKEFMWFYGMYLANGSFIRGSFRITLNYKGKEKEITRIKNCIEKLNLKYKVDYRPKKQVVEIICCSTDMTNIFNSIFGKGCANKRIPEWMLSLPVSKLKHLFLGVMQDGNGIDTVRLTSKNIMYSMLHIAHRLKKQVYFYYNPPYVGKDMIVRKSTWMLSTKNLDASDKRNNARRIIYKKINGVDYALIPIKDIKQSSKQPKYVYDITVKNSHTFLTRFFAVHNCGKHLTDFYTILDPTKDRESAKYEDNGDYYAEEIFDENYRRLLEEPEERSSFYPNAIPWLPVEDWRGIKGKLLNKIGAGIIYDHDNDTTMAYLPCKVNGVEVGGIRANIVKKGKRNYFNTKGSWTADKGLFPLDYTLKLINRRNLKTLVLVEGPRDALRCLQYGIPAAAILGCGNWNDIKADIVLMTGVERLITAMDGDKAGKRATKKVFASLKSELTVRNFDFSKFESIEESKRDPGGCPTWVLKKLKQKIY